MYLYKAGILIEKSVNLNNFYSQFEEMIGVPTILVPSDKLMAYQTYQVNIINNYQILTFVILIV